MNAAEQQAFDGMRDASDQVDRIKTAISRIEALGVK